MTAAVVALVLGVLALWAVAYPLLRRQSVELGPGSSDGGQIQELLDARDTLVNSMRDLENDRGLGSLSEADYQSQRAAYEREAAGVLRVLDVMGAGIEEEVQKQVAAARRPSPPEDVTPPEARNGA